MIISKEIYQEWKDQLILHDEDQWCGKYKTYGEMWIGEGYQIKKRRKRSLIKVIFYFCPPFVHQTPN